MPIQKVLIAGGGLSGLVLAQGLKRNGIPFEIFEQNESPEAKVRCYSLSLHFAIPYIKVCMDPELFKEIGGATVNPADPTDTGFAVLDGITGKVLINLNPAPNKDNPEAYRMNRQRFRKFLGKGIDIHWNKQAKEYELTEEGVVVRFDDGTETRGDVLVGADGSKSRICEQLRGQDSEATLLPVAMMGTIIRINGEQFKEFQAISRTHGVALGPETGSEGTYAMFFSLDDSNIEKDEYDMLIAISWLNESGEHGVPKSEAKQVALFKKIGLSFCEPFNSLLQNLKNDQPVQEVQVTEKIPRPWNNHGKVTLVGDAAHAMSMFREEGKEELPLIEIDEEIFTDKLQLRWKSCHA
jgi:2-polyprenyl-6-methoxyphenol hydroxylase-like FAD-dependent oxidoreductase